MSLRRNILIFGGIIVDRYVVVDKYPVPGDDALINEEFERVGGCAVNVAVTLKNLNCEPYIVATVGSDERGRRIQDYLAQHALTTSCVKKVSESPSGYCMTILDQNGERTFFTRRGCEDTFSPDMVVDSFYRQAPFVYLTGYYLLNDAYRQTILEVLIKLKRSGSIILFDPGPLVGYINRDALTTVLKISTIVTPNQSEVDKIRRTLNIKDSFHTWCLNAGIEIVIVKKGKRGADVFNKLDTCHFPSYETEMIDTSGAGDSFAGGFIAGLAHQYDLDMCMKIASACGALTSAIEGPHGTFTWEDVMHTIKRDKVINSC